jgi:NAD/NADP transhydrogenase beta subunit
MLGVELQQLGDTLRYFCTIVITLAVTWTYSIIYDVTLAGRRKYADAGTCLLRLFLRTWAAASLVFFVVLFILGAPQKPSSVALCLIVELAGSFGCGLFVAISFALFFFDMISNAFEHVYEKAAEAEKEKKQEICSALKAVMSEDQ